MLRARILVLLGLLASTACGQVPAPAPAQRATRLEVDSARLMSDLRALAADSMEGRRAGTPGAERARRYLIPALRAAGVRPFGSDLARPFALDASAPAGARGVNLVGYLPGTSRPERYIVVTAHYDHVGIRNGEIYNGADDNASGTAALLAIARHFSRAAPEHSIIFAALDAEEMGKWGARALLQDPPVERSSMVLNVNFDMVGRNDRGELFAAGAHHYPFLRPLLEEISRAAPVTLRLGHDSPDLGSDDWTDQSDHGEFHKVGIPFVYFGVEDHPDYHRPTDDAERIQPAFFVNAVRTLIQALERFDRELPRIERASRRE